MALITNTHVRLRRYIVNTRNDNVKKELNEKYGNMIPNDDLKIFCVGNWDYWEHRDLSKDAALPFLELSGIISTRKYCISMVGDINTRIVTKYMRDSIPAILGDISVWVQSSAGSDSADQKKAICEILDMLEAKLQRVNDCEHKDVIGARLIQH